MDDSLFQAEILGVHVEPQTATTIVLLGAGPDDPRVLPIFVGPAEAQAIAIGLGGVTMPRPLTHDLLLDVVTATGNTVHRITVTELRDSTFYAELTIEGPSGEVVVSCRPSDGIALATRLHIPLYVDREMFDLASVAIESGQELGEEEIESIVSEFQSFLESAEPEDFIVEGELVEGELLEGEPVEGEPVEDEPVEGELVEDEPVEDEPVKGELVEDEPVEGEDAEGEPSDDEE